MGDILSWDGRLCLMFSQRTSFTWLAFTFLSCLPVFHFGKKWLQKYWQRMPGVMAWTFVLVACLLLLVVSTSLLVGKSYNPFIYYRF
jgi:alginate O-acetyltransferase complex protein AlgI